MINMNVNQTMADMARMSNDQLKTTARMHVHDPYMMSLLSGENARRKALRPQPQGGQQPTVVDQEIAGMGDQPQALPEDTGIGTLPQQPMGKAMAGGGIVAFAEAGAVKDPLAQYEAQIRAEAIRQGVDPDMAMRLFRQESAGQAGAVGPETKAGRAVGLGQLMVPAAKEMGLKPEERSDPAKNIPASIGYFKKQLTAFKDPQVALAAYNHGPGNVQQHLAKNAGQLNMDPTSKSPEGKQLGLPKETADYINKILPIGTAYAAPTDTDSWDKGAMAGMPPEKAGTQDSATKAAKAAKAGLVGLAGGQAADMLAQEAAKGAGGKGFLRRLGLGAAAVPAAVAEGGYKASESAANTMAGMTPEQREGFFSSPMMGAMGGDAGFAAAIMNEAAKTPEKKAEARPPMPYGQQMANVGKFFVGHPDAFKGKEAETVAKTKGGIPDLGMQQAQEDFRRSEIEQQNAAAQPSPAPEAATTAAPAAPAASAEKPSWLTNDRALKMGLQMMAGSGKPGSGSALRDLMSSAGSAGIGALAQEKEERKLKSTELENLARMEALKGQGIASAAAARKSGAEADILESGQKGSVQAANIAQARMKDFTASMQGKLADQSTRDRLYNQFLLDAYNSLGIAPPTASATTPAARPGWGAATAG